MSISAWQFPPTFIRHIATTEAKKSNFRSLAGIIPAVLPFWCIALIKLKPQVHECIYWGTARYKLHG
jgi:hypothetical protein